MLASMRTEGANVLPEPGAVASPPARGFAKLRLVKNVMHRKHGATFVIAAGGTGGHVLPGLEVAKELRARGHDCCFVGTPRGLEGRLVPAAGFPIEFVAAGALKQVSMARGFRTFAGMPRARFLEALRAEGIPCSGGYRPLNTARFLTQALASRAFQKIYSEKELKNLEERNRCPENDKLCQEAVWFSQTLLLGSREDTDQIIAAVRKIQRHAAELRSSSPAPLA